MNAFLPILSGSTPTASGSPFVEYTDTATDGTDTSTYTFTSRAIGTAAGDRKVIVGIYARTPSSTLLNVTGVTIAGITASAVTGTSNPNADGATSNYTGLWIADVPSGTTATVVVTTAVNAARCAIAIYRATGISSTPSDVAVFFGAAVASGAVTLNADVGADSVVVSVAGWATSGVTASWTGMTNEDVDADVETSHYTAAHYLSTGAETPRTFSATPSVSVAGRIGSLAVFD